MIYVIKTTYRNEFGTLGFVQGLVKIVSVLEKRLCYLPWEVCFCTRLYF